MRRIRYSYTLAHVPGKTIVRADMLSRARGGISGPSMGMLAEEEVSPHVDALI